MQFTAFGRDVQAAADGFDSALASAVKSFASWFGMGLDAEYVVQATVDEAGGAQLSFVATGGRFVAPVFPQSPDHAGVTDVSQEAGGRVTAATDVPADAAPVDPAADVAVPADPAPADPAPVEAPADPAADPAVQ